MKRRTMAVAAAALTTGLALAGTAVTAPAAQAAETGCLGTVTLATWDQPNGDAKIGLKMAWDSALTGSGRPEARIATGNSLFVFNNHTDFYWLYFGFGHWREYSSGTIYAYHNWDTARGSAYVVNKGGQVGVYVNADGSVRAPWTWFKYSVSAWGFRQYIEDTSTQTPIYRVIVWDSDGDPNHYKDNDVAILPDVSGACGIIHNYTTG